MWLFRVKIIQKEKIRHMEDRNRITKADIQEIIEERKCGEWKIEAQ